MGGTQIDADRSRIIADTPLGPAPLAEAVPYTPKDFFFWNGFGMFHGCQEPSFARRDQRESAFNLR